MQASQQASKPARNGTNAKVNKYKEQEKENIRGAKAKRGWPMVYLVIPLAWIVLKTAEMSLHLLLMHPSDLLV